MVFEFIAAHSSWPRDENHSNNFFSFFSDLLRQGHQIPGMAFGLPINSVQCVHNDFQISSTKQRPWKRCQKVGSSILNVYCLFYKINPRIVCILTFLHQFMVSFLQKIPVASILAMYQLNFTKYQTFALKHLLLFLAVTETKMLLKCDFTCHHFVLVLKTVFSKKKEICSNSYFLILKILYLF